MEWINVKNRLPTVDESQGELFVWQNRAGHTAWFYPYDSPGFYGRVDPKSFYSTDAFDYEVQLSGVTHWMLPEPPELEVPDDIQTIVKNLDDMRRLADKAGE